MKIIAVVVTYNRLELLKHGLECLKKQKHLSQIIVVNNGSTDGTTEWLKETYPTTSPAPSEGGEMDNTMLNFGEVSGKGIVVNASNKVTSVSPPLEGSGKVLIINQENVGGSGGFYTGIKAAYDAGADWIWCMDDDVFPREDCLDELLKHIDKPDTGILSPRRILDGKVFTHEFQKFNFTNPFASMHGKKLKTSPDPSEGGEMHYTMLNSEKDKGKNNGNEIGENPSNKVTFVSPPSEGSGEVPIVGCDFEGPFISRKVVEKIGLPNKDLFIFCDDTDYCLRAHLAGFKLYYIPSAIMDKYKFFSNDTWTTRNQKKKWKRYYQVRNETYMNHHYGKNWLVRYVRGFIGVVGYWIPAIASMPFTKAWSMADLRTLWQAYKDGINEKLGKRDLPRPLRRRGDGSHLVV